MTISFTRPMLQYSLHDMNGGLVIYHPAGEIRITDCPKCNGPLAGLTERNRPDARHGTVRMMICPSCRSDISGRVIDILVDLTRSLSHVDEKGEYARYLDRDRRDGDGSSPGGVGRVDPVGSPRTEEYDDNPSTRARRSGRLRPSALSPLDCPFGDLIE